MIILSSVESLTLQEQLELLGVLFQSHIEIVNQMLRTKNTAWLSGEQALMAEEIIKLTKIILSQMDKNKEYIHQALTKIFNYFNEPSAYLWYLHIKSRVKQWW